MRTGPALRSGVNFLLRGAVELAGDIRHERRTVLGVSEPVNQNDQHKRPGRKNDPGIVANFGDFAGLVRYARACGKPGGDAVVEALTLKEFVYLAGGLLIHRLATSARARVRGVRS